MHNLNNPETTVTNYVNAMTHTDVITAHHWARCAPCESSYVFTLSHLAQGPRPCRFHLIPSMHVHLVVSWAFSSSCPSTSSSSPSSTFLIPSMVPDENFMEDPLCNSAIGSMVSLDYVTPDPHILMGNFDVPILVFQRIHPLTRVPLHCEASYMFSALKICRPSVARFFYAVGFSLLLLVAFPALKVGISTFFKCHRTPEKSGYFGAFSAFTP